MFACLGTSHMGILVFDVLLEPIGMEFAASILQVLLPLYKLQMAIDSTSLTFMFQISGLFLPHILFYPFSYYLLPNFVSFSQLFSFCMTILYILFYFINYYISL